MDQKGQKPATRDYLLRPGYIYLPDRPTTISTVLGSSVAFSLWDRKQKIGGMSHFLFPQIQPGDKSTAMYGNVAVLTLIQMMSQRGSKQNHLEAQLFGGAFNSRYCDRDVGSDSLKIARQILKQKKIKIVSEDIGGELGRKIVFNTLSCEIVILKVERLRSGDWYPYHNDRA